MPGGHSAAGQVDSMGGLSSASGPVVLAEEGLFYRALQLVRPHELECSCSVRVAGGWHSKPQDCLHFH